MPKIKLNEDEHKLIIRYREQARAFNEGIAAALNAIALIEQPEGYEEFYSQAAIAIAKQRKDTP